MTRRKKSNPQAAIRKPQSPQTTEEHRPAPGQARKVVGSRRSDPERLQRILALATEHRANPGHVAVDSGDYCHLVQTLAGREDQLDDEQRRIFAPHQQAAEALKTHSRQCTLKAADLFWLATLAEALDRSQEEPSGPTQDDEPPAGDELITADPDDAAADPGE